MPAIANNIAALPSGTREHGWSLSRSEEERVPPNRHGAALQTPSQDIAVMGETFGGRHRLIKYGGAIRPGVIRGSLGPALRMLRTSRKGTVMGRSTVLLVDDEPAIRELLADVLRDGGYDVVEARDGVEALRTLEQHALSVDSPSLIVLDLMLPNTDGLEVLGHLAAQGVRLPVVVMSTSRDLLSAAVAAGARAVLRKPFDLNDLLRLVAQCAQGDHCLTAPNNHVTV